MKILITEAEVHEKQVLTEIKNQCVIPHWLSNTRCDLCGHYIEKTHTTMSFQTGLNSIYHAHDGCFYDGIKPENQNQLTAAQGEG